MACRFEVTLPMWARGGIALATSALNAIDALEDQLSVFRETSEVSHLNRRAAIEAVTVEKSLFDLLALCQQLHHETGGAFDVTAGPLTRCWGFLRREGRIPPLAEIEQARSLVGSGQLLLNSEARTISFTQPGVEINLGSIGKGYALDQVANSLRGPIQSALLNAGASTICAIGAGERGERGWRVGLRDPRSRNQRIAALQLRDCALSTSGSEEQFFEHDGKRYGHIIDPRSGWPAQTVISVSVVARSAAISDALATAFYVGGRELAEAYCASHAEVLAIMIERDSDRPIVIGENDRCAIERIGS
jgi:FAD:protein FMN transferase